MASSLPIFFTVGGPVPTCLQIVDSQYDTYQTTCDSQNYTVYVNRTTVTLKDQYGNTTNALTNITVYFDYITDVCGVGGSTSGYATITAGTSQAYYEYTASEPYGDCYEPGCITNTQTYNGYNSSSPSYPEC